MTAELWESLKAFNVCLSRVLMRWCICIGSLAGYYLTCCICGCMGSVSTGKDIRAQSTQDQA